ARLPPFLSSTSPSPSHIYTLSLHDALPISISALRAAAAGLADTIASYSLVHESGVQDRLYPAPLEPVMRENYAFVQRRGAQLSRGARVIKENLKMVLDTLPIDAPEAS